jgi:hypothetical protein
MENYDRAGHRRDQEHLNKAEAQTLTNSLFSQCCKRLQLLQKEAS